MKDASLNRLDNSLVLIVARTGGGEATGVEASTILPWVREYREVGGHFKRDDRGVNQRGWMLCGEDVQVELLKLPTGFKNLSKTKTQDFIHVLLAPEGGVRRMVKHWLTMPISSTIVYPLVIKLGCKWEPATLSLFTDGHKRSGALQARED